MLIDFSAHAVRWELAAPVDALTVAVDAHDVTDTRTGLVIDCHGLARGGGGDHEALEDDAGILALRVPFRDGTTRRAYVVTSPPVADEDTVRRAQDSLSARVQRLRAAAPDELIAVVHPFERTLRAGRGGSRRTFERLIVDAGADVVVGTGDAPRPHIDIVRGRPVLHGCGTAVTIEILPDRSAVHVRPSAPTAQQLDPLTYTALLAHTHDVVSFQRAVGSSSGEERRAVSIELDGGHRAPAYLGTHGTTTTEWEAEPAPLRFDRGVPARTYMWERELDRCGASVDTIGTDAVVGASRKNEPLLVHSGATSRTGVPGAVAAENGTIACRVLRDAGVPVQDATSEPEAGEQVRISIVDGAARAASQSVSPVVVGDGRRTIRELVNEENDARWADVHLHDALIALTPRRLERLERDGFSPFSILPAGDVHALDSSVDLASDPANGADHADVTDTIHPSYLRAAEAVVRAFPGLLIASVDVRSPDLTRPAAPDAHIVTAVSAHPDLAAHAAPVSGIRRNVVAAAAEAVLAPATAPVHVRRHRRPDPVGSPTSARLLAAEFAARGFDIDWLTEELFFARGHGPIQGVHGAMTDRTSLAARMVLSRPQLRRRILADASLPLSPTRTFGHRARDRAWQYALSFDAATVQFGGDRPIELHGMTRREFDEVWKQNLSTTREHRAAVARRFPGERVRLLVAHGRVLSVLRESSAAVSRARGLHRSHHRLAADAARAFAGADITQVTLLVARPDVPATADSVVVEHVSVDPDLVAHTVGERRVRDVVRTLVDLHLGATRPRPQPQGVWADDATATPSRFGSLARRASRKAVRELGRRLAPVPAAARVDTGGLRFEIADGTARLVGAASQLTDLVVPGAVEGVPVTAVAEDSMADDAGLRSVELPPSVRTIGDRAFRGCRGLRTVVLPTDLERIGDHAFADCASLSTIEYFIATGPKKERVVRRSLVESSLPQGVVDIGVGAFATCAELAHLTVPHRVTRIRESILSDCTSLRSVWLHNGVEQMDSYAFAGCTALESVRLPDALTDLHVDAFDPRTTIVCAAGSSVHERARELGLTVAPYPASPPVIDSALGAEDRETVREVLASDRRLQEITTRYELRPAMDGVARRTADRDRPLPKARFHRVDGEYRPTASTDERSDVTITMVGDLMCGASQQRSALRDDEYDFSESFDHVRRFFHDADLSLGNLETMVSDSHPLTSESLYVDGRPHLNAPSAYLTAVRDAGIDAVLSAQNHMYDTGTRGILETLDALNDAQLVHGGLHASAEEDRFLLFRINGMSIGVVAHLDPNRQRMKKASFTTEGLAAMASLLEPHRVPDDIAAARAAGAEFVLAYCHWGEEYTEKISRRQSEYAHMVADAGADYIFGSHSHCPQHYAILTTPDGRQVPAVYSGGNFVSHITRHRPVTQDTFISSLTLTRDESNRVVMKRDGYLPCRIVAQRGIRGRVSVVPLDDLEQGELGYSPTSAQKDRERIAEALGTRYRSRARTSFP